MQRSARIPARSAVAVVTLVALLALGACGSDANTTESTGAGSEEEPTVSTDLTVTAVEYEFQGPDTLPAGSSTITFENGGEEQHELQLALLDEGKTIEDVQALFEQEGGPEGPPKWATIVGGTGAKPGKSSTLDVDLESGTYVMVCTVPAEDGTPHAALGMVKEVTVA